MSSRHGLTGRAPFPTGSFAMLSRLARHSALLALSTALAVAQPAGKKTGNDPGLTFKGRYETGCPAHFRVRQGRAFCHRPAPRRFSRSTKKTSYRNLKVFRREDVPVSLGILVDNSGSMRDKRQQVNTAAVNFVKASNPKDEVFHRQFSMTRPSSTAISPAMYYGCRTPCNESTRAAARRSTTQPACPSIT